MEFWGDHYFHRNGLQPCTVSGSVAIVADLQERGLSLWAEGINDCYIDSVPWNTWPELKPPPIDDVMNWTYSVQGKILQLLEDTTRRANTEGIELIPTGDAWTEDLLNTLRFRNTSLFTIHEISQPKFAASLNAANFARFEERSLAGEGSYYGPEIPYYGPGYIRTWGWDDHVLQHFGGKCKTDQDCEEVCKVRGPPVCHPIDHDCWCTELWEAVPGSGRENMDGQVWYARHAVFEALSGTCKVEVTDTCSSLKAKQWWDRKAWEEKWKDSIVFDGDGCTY